MKALRIPLSVLDLSPITEGGNAALSFRNTLDLAQHAERWGYNRFWMAEHHGMPGIAEANDAEAIFLASSMQQAFVNLRSGRSSRLKPPVKDYVSTLTPTELSILDQTHSRVLRSALLERYVGNCMILSRVLAPMN